MTQETEAHILDLPPISYPKLIRPAFQPPVQDASFDLYLSSFEQLIEKILPESFLQELADLEEKNFIKKWIHQFHDLLPIIKCTRSHRDLKTLSFIVLCHAEYTHGVYRYVPDMISRWLLPGKHLAIVGGRTLDFHFSKTESKTYYIAEYFIKLSHENELALIEEHLPQFMQEIRLNILAVYHARYIVSVKKLSFDQKTTMIQEKLSSLLNVNLDANMHDQMQSFLIKLSSEEKIHQAKETLESMMHKRPRFFDRSVFYEIHYFTMLLRDKFAAIRDVKHLGRIIGFQYLFKKTIKGLIETKPNERHLSLKLLKTNLNISERPNAVLGILVAMNLLRETERFEKRHIIEAIQNYIPEIQYVKDSYILDRRDEKIRSFYLETEKLDGTKFTRDEIRTLRSHLPKELNARVENVIHPIFMPRNEEEILRNIIILSKQLKYVRDMPQVIITYDKQSDQKLSFTVILVRLLRGGSLDLKKLFKKSHLEFSMDEKKIVGYLKRKHSKEANIFHVFLDKTPFFRKDYSLDLQKARKTVVSELTEVIGEFRDYNGGMIVKQSEALEHLRDLVGKSGIKNDFLMENFFYSIRPGIMQSILSPQILKILFIMLVDNLEKGRPALRTYSDDKYFFLLIITPSDLLKDEVRSAASKLKIPPYDLTTSHLHIQDMHALGFIYRSDNPDDRSLLFEAMQNTIEKVEQG